MCVGGFGSRSCQRVHVVAFFPREGLRSWRIPLRGPRDEYPPRDFLVATRGNQNALSLVACNMYVFYDRLMNIRLLGRSVALSLTLINIALAECGFVCTLS